MRTATTVRPSVKNVEPHAPVVPAWGDLMPSLQERTDMKRRFIVREAARSFNKTGFHGTSMGDIAKRLGVTKAALYRYVQSKHELLFESFNVAMDSAFANLENGERLGNTGLEKLKIAMKGYLVDLIGNLGHPVVLLEENALLPEQALVIVERRDEAERRYRELIKEGITDGSIAPCDPKLAVFTLLGAVNWVPKWYREGGAWSADEVAESLVELATRGLAARHSQELAPTHL